jgi:DMSO/TMAO reductase YedYZ molybdopterin-dependent catalytic subunit
MREAVMFDSERRRLEQQMRDNGRLPPGQSATLKWPVLHYGPVHQLKTDTWSLRVFGLVEEERTWTWNEFAALPTTTITCDIHCVTAWSKFDMQWEGVLFRDFLALHKVRPEAKFVIAHAPNFTANMPLEAMLEDDVLLAYRADGEYLAPDHGFPVRTLVPARYFWKSTKWLTGLEFLAEDQLGFWERAGYHNEADPFKEQRYSGR